MSTESASMAINQNLATAQRSVSSLTDGDVALAVAVTAQLMEFYLAYPATIVKMTLVVICTLSGRVAFLPAILVCQLYSSDFLLQGLQSYEYLLDRYDASRVYVFGFPLTTNYVFALSLTAKVLSQALSKPETFRGLVSRFAVFLWVACFPLAVLAAASALSAKGQSWSAPIRDVMMVGCYFLGLIMGEDREAAKRVIVDRIVPMSLVMLCLAMLGLFYCRGMYWITAAGPAVFLVRCVSLRAGVSLFASCVWGGLATAYAFAFYPTSFAKEVAIGLYSTAATTFALKGMWFGGVAATALAAIFQRRKAAPNKLLIARWLRTSRVAWISAAVMILFPLVLAAASYSVKFDPSSKNSSKSLSLELPWQDRFLYKLLYDRAPIYRGAIDEVCSPPYFYKTGERASYRLLLNGDKTPWPAGSHNLVLEELRRNGWYSGVVCLGIIVSAMMMACTVMFKTSDPLLVWYAAASFVTLLVSGVTSHIPMETNAAVWMLTPAGIAAAMYKAELRAVAQKVLPGFQREDSFGMSLSLSQKNRI